MEIRNEIQRVLAPHLAQFCRELHALWPTLNPELTLLHWLCERNHLKPPLMSLTTRASPVSSAQPAPPPLPRERLHHQLPPVLARIPAVEDASCGRGALTERGPRTLEPLQRGLSGGDKDKTARPEPGADELFPGLKSLANVSLQIKRDAGTFEYKLEETRRGCDRVIDVVANMRHEARGKFIAKVPLLSSDVLSQDEQHSLVGKLRPWNYQAGEVIVSEGDTDNRLFIIEQGICDVFRKDSDGVEHRVGDVKREGSFGEMSVVSGQPRTATVRARTNATILTLSQHDLFSSIGKDTLSMLHIIVRAQVVGAVPLLGQLSASQKVCVAKRLRSDTWEEGAVLAVQNAHVSQATRRMYIIEQGSCRMEMRGAQLESTGTEVSTLDRGEYFGMVSMFYGCPFTSKITAESLVKTLSISYDDLLNLCDTQEDGSEILNVFKKAMRQYLLQHVEQLSGLVAEDWERVTEATTEVTYKTWDNIFSRGSQLDKVYVLVEGQLTEHNGNSMALKDDDLLNDHWHQEDNIVTWSRPGKAFGLECLRDKLAVAPTTLAASTKCVLLCIPGIVLRSVLNPDAGERRLSLLNYAQL